MRALLSTIGSRGDVQPVLALGLRLQALGHEVRVCAPPDFRAWIESLGIAAIPIGPEVRCFVRSRPTGTPLTPERRRQMAEASVATQFETLASAAQGCDAIVAATALQVAARSVAEKMGIVYVFAAYAPVVLPSAHHAPPPLPVMPGQSLPATHDNLELWERDAARFNDLFGAAVNAGRASLGLGAIGDVRSHMITERPWLAADATLGPWPESIDGRGRQRSHTTRPADEPPRCKSAGAAGRPAWGPGPMPGLRLTRDGGVFQTGAWILPDERPLSRELSQFLDGGDPPLYFGFGSTRPPEGAGAAMVQAARALGRRAIVSQGWFDDSLVNGESDCLSIGEVNVHALFARVAAVVHHGGAGTTTAAALAGVPQVVIPNHYDQHYWAQRVHTLGIGIAHTADALTGNSLTSALSRCLGPEMAARARAVAGTVRRDGSDVAARELIALI